MITASSKFFEQACVWDSKHRHNPVERKRIEDTISSIPSDARTILDAGCGSGVFLNSLKASWTHPCSRFAGLDTSAEALKSVQAETHQASIADMPFEKGEFDVVTCLEVLEHLNDEDLASAVSELERVSRRYLLVTVPNQEDLLQNLAICPRCSCCFSPWLHIQSFNEDRLSSLFKTFRLEECRAIGPVTEQLSYHPIVRGIHLLWTRPTLPDRCLCPQCHYRKPVDKTEETAPKQSRGIVVETAKKAKRLLGRMHKRRKWLLGLYVRDDRR